MECLRAADAEIKIYNETGSATAKNLVFHGKFGINW